MCVAQANVVKAKALFDAIETFMQKSGVYPGRSLTVLCVPVRPVSVLSTVVHLVFSVCVASHCCSPFCCKKIGGPRRPPLTVSPLGSDAGVGLESGAHDVSLYSRCSVLVQG
jgi:hypothetical protein